MKSNLFSLIKYDADEGKVFDWADLTEHQVENKDGTITQEHLYAKTIFVGPLDSIDNYIEIEDPKLANSEE